MPHPITTRRAMLPANRNAITSFEVDPDVVVVDSLEGAIDANVGSCDGDEVGLLLGDSASICDGVSVGVFVGSIVGSIDGLELGGSVVGGAVGFGVGFVVGSTDGLLIGAWDGGVVVVVDELVEFSSKSINRSSS